MDCHNRPAHTFEFTPERAVDNAMAEGRIPRELPFVRREALAAVSAEYPDRQAALDGDRVAIARLLPIAAAAGRPAWSSGRSPGRRTSGRAMCFPAMNVKWGTLSESHRPHRHARLLPLPRRRAQGEGRQGHPAGLRVVPQRGPVMMWTVVRRNVSLATVGAVLSAAAWATAVVVRAASAQGPQKPIEGVIVPGHGRARNGATQAVRCRRRRRLRSNPPEPDTLAMRPASAATMSKRRDMRTRCTAARSIRARRRRNSGAKPAMDRGRSTKRNRTIPGLSVRS